MKKIIIVILVLIMLSACTKNNKEGNTTNITETDQTTNTEIINEEPQVPFGYDRLDNIGREIYDLLASGLITIESPYMFDVPLSYETVSKPIELYRYNTIKLVPLGEYLPYYQVIIADEVFEQYSSFSYGYILKGAPPIGALIPLSGEAGLYADKGIISGIMLKPLIHDDDPASGTMLIRLNEHNTGVTLAAEEWLKLLPSIETDDYEKTLALAVLMCEKIEYEECTDSESIYGAVVNNKAVCEGYARTFSYFANLLELEVLYVSGTANDIGHAWNMVRLNGTWYHVDVTWMDAETGINRTYFLCSDESIRRNMHDFNQLNYFQAWLDNYYDPFYKLPECPLDYES